MRYLAWALLAGAFIAAGLALTLAWLTTPDSIAVLGWTREAFMWKLAASLFAGSIGIATLRTQAG